MSDLSFGRAAWIRASVDMKPLGHEGVGVRSRSVLQADSGWPLLLLSVTVRHPLLPLLPHTQPVSGPTLWLSAHSGSHGSFLCCLLQRASLPWRLKMHILWFVLVGKFLCQSRQACGWHYFYICCIFSLFQHIKSGQRRNV